MGVYDNYIDYDTEQMVQLKVGPCELHTYEIGDTVNIPDGVYIGHEGIVVIHNKKLLRIDEFLTSKYGEQILPKDIITNPIEEIVEKIVKEHMEKNHD